MNKQQIPSPERGLPPHGIVPATPGPQRAPRALVVMGVAGCGKSSLAAALSEALGWTLLEGDDYHGAENKARMKAGIALTDADRAGWLAALGQELNRHPKGVVLSCSALKHRYREFLRAQVPGLQFVYLDIDQALAQQRVQARAGGHYFPPQLVASQFEALEPPLQEAGVLRVPATDPIPRLCDAVLGWLSQASSFSASQP